MIKPTISDSRCSPEKLYSSRNQCLLLRKVIGNGLTILHSRFQFNRDLLMQRLQWISAVQPFEQSSVNIYLCDLNGMWISRILSDYHCIGRFPQVLFHNNFHLRVPTEGIV